MNKTVVRSLLVVASGLTLGTYSGQMLRSGSEAPPTEPASITRYSAETSIPLQSSLPQIALVVTKKDVFTCEDLGRQLRVALRTLQGRAEDRIVVWYEDGSDLPTILDFLDQERVPWVSEWMPAEIASLLGTPLATPAVFLLYPGGRLIGVGYPNRVTGVRDFGFLQVFEAALADDG